MFATIGVASACDTPSVTAPVEDPVDDADAAFPREAEATDTGDPDGWWLAPDTGRPGPPPPSPCDLDAAVRPDGALSEVCPLPKPYCYDDRNLVVFSNGTCKAGHCQYTWSYFDCHLVGQVCGGGECYRPPRPH